MLDFELRTDIMSPVNFNYSFSHVGCNIACSKFYIISFDIVV